MVAARPVVAGNGAGVELRRRRLRVAYGNYATVSERANGVVRDALRGVGRMLDMCPRPKGHRNLAGD